jgi:hypothetical protein
MSVLDDHTSGSGFYSANAPGSVSEQDYVTGQTLDRKILIERTDHGPFRFGHNREKRGFWNRSATGDCR